MRKEVKTDSLFIYSRLRKGFWQNEITGKEILYSSVSIKKLYLDDGFDEKHSSLSEGIKDWLETNLQEKEPSAKIISMSHIVLCLSMKNEEWHKSYEYIKLTDYDFELDQLFKSYLTKFGSEFRKFQLGIKYEYQVDYTYTHEHWLRQKQTKELMLRRCLEIWPCLKTEQIQKGLALTTKGKRLIGGQIGVLNHKQVIKKQGNGDNTYWEVIDKEDLKHPNYELLPDSGIKAAKQRAHEWKLQRSQSNK